MFFVLSIVHWSPVAGSVEGIFVLPIDGVDFCLRQLHRMTKVVVNPSPLGVADFRDVVYKEGYPKPMLSGFDVHQTGSILNLFSLDQIGGCVDDFKGR